MRQGDYAGARARYEEAAALRREVGRPLLTAFALLEAAHATWCQQDYEAVRAHLEEALGIFRYFRDKAAFAMTLESFAGLAAMEDEPERAARLFGAVDRLYADPNLPKQGWWPPLQQRLRDAARDILESAAYAKAREEGRAMTLEQAIAYALT
jgi:non-specific serine/threonine protein kinase